ncbi:hypothetical protein [Ferrimicrobium sp.]|uniref:hypothetical protein n=1 Tax=Ferrimicrobium sp. TaxID=2926050 RepID=UPI002604A27F|nr:hypothetical protein [Ferrimicrobium sp.]
MTVRSSRIIAWTLLTLGIVAPVAGTAVVLVAVPDNLASVTPAPSPITSPITTTQDYHAQQVRADLTWSKGVGLRAPGWQGIVTALDTRPGAVITTGDPIISVNGVTRIALHSVEPFYAPIGPGSVGPDVAYLREALAPLALGDVGSGDVFNAPLEAVVTKLAQRLDPGVPIDSLVTFDPNWVLFMPTQSVTVAHVVATVGLSAPSPGSPVIEAATTLDPFRLDVSSPPASVSGYELLASGGVSVPVAAGFQVTDTQSLAKVAAAVGVNATSLTGTLRLVKPIVLPTVPNTAVVTGQTGANCIFSPRGGHFVPHIVHTIGGPPGETEVTGLPPSISKVLVNPAAARPDLSCP